MKGGKRGEASRPEGALRVTMGVYPALSEDAGWPLSSGGPGGGQVERPPPKVSDP